MEELFRHNFSYLEAVMLLLAPLLADVLISKTLNVYLNSYFIVLMNCLPADF